MQSRINGVAGTLTGTLDNSSDNDFPGAGLPLSLLDTFALPTDKFGRIAGTFLNTGGAGPYFRDTTWSTTTMGFLKKPICSLQDKSESAILLRHAMSRVPQAAR